MEVRELRLGNIITIVSAEHWIGCVTSICKAKDGVYVISNDKCQNINIEHCFPIPLTKEWLLKFGFVLVSGIYWTFNHISFEEEEPGDFRPSTGIGINNFGICINYVHQLQNLIFALTGEELKIKEL